MTPREQFLCERDEAMRVIRATRDPAERSRLRLAWRERYLALIHQVGGEALDLPRSRATRRGRCAFLGEARPAYFHRGCGQRLIAAHVCHHPDRRRWSRRRADWVAGWCVLKATDAPPIVQHCATCLLWQAQRRLEFQARPEADPSRGGEDALGRDGAAARLDRNDGHAIAAA